MAVRGKSKGSLSGMNEVATSREYFNQIGEYLVELLQATHDTTQQGKEFYSGDFKIIVSDNPECPAGATRSVFIQKGEFVHYFQRDIKDMISALDPDAEDYEALSYAAAGEEQALKGKRALLKVIPDPKGKTNPKTGAPYLRIKFVSLADAGLPANAGAGLSSTTAA